MAEGKTAAEVEQSAREALHTFEAELQSYVAERDFYILQFMTEGGPRYGKAEVYASTHAKELMKMDDAQLYKYVERYYTKTMPADMQAAYKSPGATVEMDKFVEGLFDDIANRHEALKPKP